MTPIEFFRRLTALPDKTPLSLPHVAAVVEMLSGLLTHELDGSVSQQARATDPVQFAKWIGEPQKVVRGWQASMPASPIRYRLSALVDWFMEHSLPLTDPMADAQDEAKRRAVIAWWADAIPVLVVEDRLIGFFRSLPLEREPASYRVLFVHPDGDDSSPVLPASQDDGFRLLETQDMTREKIAGVQDALAAFNQFAKEVWHAPDKQAGKLYRARTTYNAVQGRVISAILLRFFQAVIWHELDYAKKIAQEMDTAFLRTHFQWAAWLYEYRLEHGFSEVAKTAIGDAVNYLISLGSDVNRSVRIGDTQVAFQGTAAHVMADTLGETFRLEPVQNEDCSRYNVVLNVLYEAGLNVDKPNDQRLTGRAIAQAVEQKHGSNTSHFLSLINKHELTHQLEQSLPTGRQGKKTAI